MHGNVKIERFSAIMKHSHWLITSRQGRPKQYPMIQIQMTKTLSRLVSGLNIDGFVKNQKAAFRSWFDTSPRTEDQALRITSKRSP
jgi:hypothetical protein